jgi:hypothetical protein
MIKPVACQTKAGKGSLTYNSMEEKEDAMKSTGDFFDPKSAAVAVAR